MDISKIAMVMIGLIAVFLIGTMIGYYVRDARADVNTQADGNATSPALQASHPTFGLSDNNTTVTMEKNTTFIIRLDENPTTGYMWDISTSQGLNVIESTITVNNTGLIGSGGIHEWHINAAREGMQGFYAVYKQPWMNTTGAERVYKLNIDVTDE